MPVPFFAAVFRGLCAPARPPAPTPPRWVPLDREDGIRRAVWAEAAGITSGDARAAARLNLTGEALVLDNLAGTFEALAREPEPVSE